MALVGGAALIAGSTIYSANKASKAAKASEATANRAADLAVLPRSTNNGSYVNPGAGIGNIDPRIRAMRERSLNNVPQYQSILNTQLQDTLGGINQSGNELRSLYGQTNDNAFMDPILQRLAMQRGNVQQGLVNRGLGGSSFYSQALGNFDSAAAPGIAAARQQGLTARQGLLADYANNQTQGLSAASQGVSQLQNLDNQYASISGQNLNQELAALGLSQADIGSILGAGQLQLGAGQLRADSTGKTLDAFGKLIGSYGGYQSGFQNSSLGY